MENFRDYKLAEIYDYRWDIGNHRMWRPRPDGRLRWILFDCDVGFGGFWSQPSPWTFNMLRAVLEPSGSLYGHNNETTVFLLNRLLTNDEFRVGFIQRAADLLNTTFEPGRVVGVIDRMSAGIAPEITEHASRWRQPASSAVWAQNVEALRTFARERPANLRRHFMLQFKLAGLVNVRVPQLTSGTVNVNTLTGLGSSGPAWSGVYFRGVPLRLEAVPATGWIFAGWKGLPGFTNATIRLSLGGDFEVAPQFEPGVVLRLEAFHAQTAGQVRIRIHGLPAARVVLERSASATGWKEEAAVVLGLDGTGELGIPSDGGMSYIRARLEASSPGAGPFESTAHSAR